MTTSGDTTWQLQRDEVISSALRKVGFAEGEIPNATQISDAAIALNAIVAEWRTDGMPVWAMKTYTMPLVAGQQDYLIGVGKLINTPAPLKLIQAIRIETTGGTRVPLNIYTDYDFKLLSNFQSTQGVPVQIYYQPRINEGTLRFWPIPDVTTAADFTIELTYQRPFEDFDAATDTPDFPSYFTRALIYALALDLAPEYGLSVQDTSKLERQADKSKMAALSFGTEEGSIRFMPDWVMIGGMNKGY